MGPNAHCACVGRAQARAYYGLLALPTPALLKVAAERPGRFFPAEYQALLQARGPARPIRAAGVAPGSCRGSSVRA
jgi:hypothetical protein